MDQMTVEQMQDYRENFGPVLLRDHEKLQYKAIQDKIGPVFFRSREGQYERMRYMNSIGIDSRASETIFPDTEYVYCVSHMVPHTVGWCTMDAANKYPLVAKDMDAAYKETHALNFPIMGNKD